VDHSDSEAFIVVSNQFTLNADAETKFGEITRSYLKQTQVEEGNK
jgi:hypothetical protein